METETELKRLRHVIARQRRALHASLVKEGELVRQGLAEGIGPTRLSKLTGLHISRISQMRNET